MFPPPHHRLEKKKNREIFLIPVLLVFTFVSQFSLSSKLIEKKMQNNNGIWKLKTKDANGQRFIDVIRLHDILHKLLYKLLLFTTINCTNANFEKKKNACRIFVFGVCISPSSPCHPIWIRESRWFFFEIFF